MKYQRKSNFITMIAGLVAQKHALGYLYSEGERILNEIDLFCYEYFPHETTLTKEIGLRWAERRQTEDISSQRKRISVIRGLAKYINSLGENAYVIPVEITSRKRPPRYVPHIYAKDELSAFFYEVDHLHYCSYSPGRHLVFPVLFRLLYCCGLRPIEARTLLSKNVDLENGVIRIIESKGHNDRNVVLAHDVLALCRKYRTLISEIYPDCEYFFPNQNATSYYTKSALIITFCHSCQKAGLSNFSGNPPRIYDFRHSFATHCLYRWMREGKDLNAYLPYLSAYLGHVQLSDTAYYIHLVPEFFPQMGQMNITKFETLLPEVEK